MLSSVARVAVARSSMYPSVPADCSGGSVTSVSRAMPNGVSVLLTTVGGMEWYSGD